MAKSRITPITRVSAYDTTDGKTFTDRNEAVRWQAAVDLRDLMENHAFDHETQTYADFLSEHYDELARILRDSQRRN